MDHLAKEPSTKVRKYPFLHNRQSECATPLQSDQPRKGDKPPVSLHMVEVQDSTYIFLYLWLVKSEEIRI